MSRRALGLFLVAAALLAVLAPPGQAHHKPGHRHGPTTTQPEAVPTTTTLAATTTTGEPLPTTTVTLGSGFAYDTLVLVSDSNSTAQGKIDGASSSAVVGFEAGVHYERKVTPKLGQILRGDPSGLTVFDGSRLVTGWTGSNPWVATHTIADRGVFTEAIRSADLGAQYPEELFFETPGSNTGWTRKIRTGTPSTSTPAAGKWTISYSAGTLRVVENPTSVNVRISVTDRAIVSPGTGAGGLLIEDITTRKYATETRVCPWANGNSPDHRDWTIRRVASLDNHGAGASILPGDTLRNVQLGYNGQLGFNARTSVGGYENGWELIDSEVLRNMRAQYDWGWEGGTSKFSTTPNGSVSKPVRIANSWVHHNQGPGLWADVNLTVSGHSTIESNLIEDNEIDGVFWEISHGTATIRWNRALRNGAGSVANNGGPATNDESGTGYDISNSRGVLLTQNVSDGSPTGVMVRDDDRDPFLNAASIQDNSIKATGGTGSGNVIKFRPGAGSSRIATSGADGNRYWTGAPFSYNNTFGMTFAAWQAARSGGGLTGALDPNGTGGLTGSVTDPSTFTAFTLSHYGPGS